MLFLWVPRLAQGVSGMNSTEKLYDLFVFDCGLQGDEREEAKAKLAKLLKIKAEQVEPLLNGLGTAVGQAVTLETAQKFHQTLTAIHIRCNYRPSTSRHANLQLAPLKPEKTLTCPACACLHQYPEDEPAPTICEKCGLVFAKYERVEQVKEERDKIKRALLAQHQRMLDAEREEREKREQALRRAALEQQIRKELGLPKFAASRSGLMSTGAAVFVLGVSLGGGGVIAVQAWTQTDESSPAAHAGQTPAALSQLNFERQIEQLQALEAQAAAPTQAEALPPAADAPRHSPALETSVSPLLKDMLAEFEHDAEWDGFLLGRAKAAFERGALAEAMQTLAGASQAQLKAAQGAAWADWLMRQNYAAQAENLYAYLARSFEKLPAGSADQIEALALLAQRQAAVGLPAQAEALLKTAEKLAASAPALAEQAVGAAALAAAQASLAHAPADFRKAQAGLASIASLAEREVCRVRLARIYAQAGPRMAANSLLQESFESLAGMEAAARLHAEWGETAAALALARKLPGADGQERLLYRLLAVAMAAGHAQAAPEILDALRQPAWRARAQGLLAAAAQVPGALENARKSAQAIASPPEKAALLSELARIAAHGGDSGGADQLFGQAQTLADALADAASRDAALTLLAYNQARALRASAAQAHLGKIGNAAWRENIQRVLAQSKTWAGF
jgi:hypothetical protein